MKPNKCLDLLHQYTIMPVSRGASSTSDSAKGDTSVTKSYSCLNPRASLSSTTAACDVTSGLNHAYHNDTHKSSIDTDEFIQTYRHKAHKCLKSTHVNNQPDARLQQL